MMTLTIVSLCIAVGGIVLMLRGGVPESVSGLVYNLSERMRWAWSGWLIAVATTLMVPLMSALGDVAWLGWLTVVCLIGAAVTPVFNRDTRTTHYVCGIAAGVLSQVCVACICPWWLLVWPVWLLVFTWKTCGVDDWKHAVLWMEMTAAAAVYGALIL